MMHTCHAARTASSRSPTDERGMALSVWVAASMVFFVLALGIGIDFAGHAAAQQDARASAAQAARAGGQAIDAGTGTGKVTLDLPAGRRAATQLLASSSYNGTVAVAGNTITVTITGAEYRTKFLSIIGINSIPIRAVETAVALRSLNGQER